MNKKGFAISIILYSLVFLLITILFMILGIFKTRYNVSDNTRKSVIENINESDYGYVIYRKAIKNQTCMTWTDNMGTASKTNDDVTYIARCRDNYSLSNYKNYVWYSGKLWRIVALYPDKTMKLVTDDIITSISYGSSSSDFNNSWVYQWLNEDFLDTLYNADKIVADSVWNYTFDHSNRPSRPESLPNQQTLTAKVGLLSGYEFINTGAHKNNPVTGDDIKLSYLNNIVIGDGSDPVYWWLINKGRSHYTNGIVQIPITDSIGIRPSIRLKYGVIFKGAGTKSNPYTIIGDKKAPTYNTTLLNTRSSGEYVNFNNEKWRIVDTSDGITKIVANNYVTINENCNYFASSSYWGAGTNNQTCNGKECCDYYYNNTWYNAIPSNYKNMMVDGTYYLGPLNSGSSESNYKRTICKNIQGHITTKTCIKWSASDNHIASTNSSYAIFVGKVGLPRIGEMFSSIVDYNEGKIYLISPIDNAGGGVNSLDGYQIGAGSGSGKIHALHLTITLSSSVKITGGSGTVDSPFEISL